MRSHSLSFDLAAGTWTSALPQVDSSRTLVLTTGSPTLADPLIFGELVHAYPRSIVIGCGRSVVAEPHSLSVTVSQFERTELHLCAVDVRGGAFTAGREAASKLAARPGLRGIVAVAHGTPDIGELRRGLASLFDENVIVSCDDGSATWLAIGRELRQSVVAAIGFYGEHIVLGADGRGTWDHIGPALSESSLPRSREAAAHAALLANPRSRTLVIPPAPSRIARPSQPAIVIPPVPAAGPGAAPQPAATSAPLPTATRTATPPVGQSAPPGAVTRPSSPILAHRPSAASVPAPLPNSTTARSAPTSTTSSTAEPTTSATSAATSAPATSAVPTNEAWDFDAADDDWAEPALPRVPALPSAPARDALRSASPAPATTPVSARSPMADSIATYGSAADPHPRDTKLGTASELRRSDLPLSSPAREDHDPLGAALAESAADVAAGRPSQVFVAARPLTSRAPIVRLPKTIGADAVVETALQDGIQTVAIRGRIAETFHGSPIGQSFASTVVVDVADVDRITSYGVREWMAMLSGAPAIARVYLARCSEPIVNQLALIRGFSGSARVASCFAPYLCSACGAEVERLVDCELDAYEVRAGALVPVPCPRCAAEARFDDDVAAYFAFLEPHLGAPVPADVRAVLDRAVAPSAATPAVDAFEKTVDAGGTRIRVHGELTGQLRWRRVVDGLEGRVVLDLSDVSSSDAAGAANLEQAVRSMPPEAGPIEIEHAPPPVVAKLALQDGQRRATVTSATITGYCASCRVHRPAALVLAQLAADRDAGRTHAVRCRRCNEVLSLSVDPSLDRLVALQHRARRFSAPPATAPAPVPALASPTSSKRIPILVIAILLAVAAGVLVLVKLVAGGNTTPPSRHSRLEQPRSTPAATPYSVAAPRPASSSHSLMA